MSRRVRAVSSSAQPPSQAGARLPANQDGHQPDHEPARPGTWPEAGGEAGAVPSWVAEKSHDTRAAYSLDTVADAAGATRIRRGFADWLGIDVEGAQGEDVVLAVYEALANAAEHAYADDPGGPGTMWLTAHRSLGHVRIAVADRGHWRAPTGAPFRSRGLELMRALMAQVHVRTDQHGTLVQLRTAVAPSPQPSET